VESLYGKYPLLSSDFKEDYIFFNFLEKKVSVIKVNQNPSSGSRVVPCGQTGGRTDGLRDRYKEINSFFSQF
jgi:hypothetical protein